MTYPGLRNRHRTAQPQQRPAPQQRQAHQQHQQAPQQQYRQAQAPLPPPIPPPPLPPPVPPPALPVATPVPTNDFERQAAHLIPAEVRMISGCHTEQTSADVRNVLSTSNLPNPAGRAGGACTSALLDILYQHDQSNKNTWTGSKPPQLTFQDLLLQLRSKLATQGFDQIPQLTSSRPLDVQTTPFDLGGHAGTKRALLIGINYRHQDGELRGCHNDVYNMQKYLVTVQGFAPHHILLLVDDGQHEVPTRKSIVLALRQLVAQSVAGDAVFVSYSGKY